MITLRQGRQRGASLVHRYSRFEPSDYAQETGPAHQPLVGEAGQHEGLRGPDFCYWYSAEPGRRLVRQNPNDGVSDSVESDAPADHIWIAIKTLAPEVLSD